MTTQYTDFADAAPSASPTFWQWTLNATHHAPDALEEALFAAGAMAVTFEDAADQPVWEPLPGHTPLWPHTRVTGLFDLSTDRTAVAAALCAFFDTDTAPEHVVTPLAAQDWTQAWKDHFHPLRFGQRLWVHPSDQLPPDPEAVTVQLDPGLAFGTGTHPSTALCLTWLDGADVRGKQVLDYGCGSGILAIAALRLGAAACYAVDIDPQAVLATRDNAAKNGLVQDIYPTTPEQLPNAWVADVLLANILANVLVDLAPVLRRRVHIGGQLVLSGILDRQADVVTTAFSPAFRFAPHITQEGWTLLVGTRQF